MMLVLGLLVYFTLDAENKMTAQWSVKSDLKSFCLAASCIRWLVAGAPPPHPGQCSTSHNSASSGELQSCIAPTQWPQFLWEKSGSGHRVDLDLGMESWRGWGGSLAFLYLYSLRLVPLCDIHRICSSFSVLFLFCHDFPSSVRQNILRTESPVVLYAELEPGWR